MCHPLQRHSRLSALAASHVHRRGDVPCTAPHLLGLFAWRVSQRRPATMAFCKRHPPSASAIHGPSSMQMPAPSLLLHDKNPPHQWLMAPSSLASFFFFFSSFFARLLGGEPGPAFMSFLRLALALTPGSLVPILVQLLCQTASSSGWRQSPWPVSARLCLEIHASILCDAAVPE